MKNFRAIIRDVGSILKSAALVNTLINAGIVMLLFYLLFSLFNLFPLILSLAVAGFYLVSTWADKTRKYTMRFVESKHPELKDKLTTAVDTIGQENFVIDKLRIEVAKKISKVDASEFFNFGRIIFKTIVLISVLGSIMVVTAYDIRLFDVQEKISEMDLSVDFSKKASGEGFASDKPGKPGDGSGSFTEDEGMKFKISNTVDLNDIQDVEEKNFKKEEFLNFEDLEAIGASDYKDPITDQEKEIVKNYFNRINEK